MPLSAEHGLAAAGGWLVSEVLKLVKDWLKKKEAKPLEVKVTVAFDEAQSGGIALPAAGPGVPAAGDFTFTGAQSPHCDAQVLHAPGECEFCDMYPTEQVLRKRRQINFTGKAVPGFKPCPSEERRPLETIERWPGNRAKKEG